MHEQAQVFFQHPGQKVALIRQQRLRAGGVDNGQQLGAGNFVTVTRAAH